MYIKGSHNITGKLYLAKAEKNQWFLCKGGKIWEEIFFLLLSYYMENIATLIQSEAVEFAINSMKNKSKK